MDYNDDLNSIDINVEDILSINEEDRWKELVDEIMAGNVIPVIGPDFQVSGTKNLHLQLIEKFAKEFGITSNPQTFSQLIYDKKFPSPADKPDAIYKLIDRVLSNVRIRPSDLLLRLLGTKKFPFVITTSFTPVVETAMQQVWGDDVVDVKQFRNDPNRDLKPGIGDVQSVKQMMKPTVYYMFGKHSTEKNRYVVTDVDMMEFCKSWLAGTNTPKVLTEGIKSKYLLVLGNNYSDWLFRFVCYSLRSSAQDLRSSLFVNTNVDDSNPLIQFLNRLETFIQRDPEVVVSEIERRVKIREEKRLIEEEKDKYDVFLSYSRKDEDFVNKLYEALIGRDLRVWHDRHCIGYGDKWKKEIQQGIKNARIFVPILTSSLVNEALEEHEYRVEWSLAIARSKKIGGVVFILPLAEKGFDFYNKLTDIPVEFSESNAIFYTDSNDFNSIAEVIAARVNEIKNLERE